MKLLINILVILFLILLSLPITLYAENLIGLPRTEGSKSFDMEINQLNNIGIKYYSLKELDKAEEKLKKATNLAQQLRDPSLGVIAFNRALVLHHLHKNKDAIKSIETTSLGAALAASIMFVLSTVYPEYSKNFCYGLIGSLTLLSGAIISIFKSINQHLSVVIAMIMLIIQGWINSF